MNIEMKRRCLKIRQKAVYAALKNADMGLYRRAVEIAHLAMIDFGGRDKNKRAAAVETAVMSLLVEVLGITVHTEEEEEEKP